MLDSSYQEVKRLFVLAYDNTTGNNQISIDSFLPRVKIENYKIETGGLLDFAYFEKNYRLIAADLIKQKALDCDSRAIQQIIFTGKIAAAANTRVIIYYIREQSKEAILEFAKGATKVL